MDENRLSQEFDNQGKDLLMNETFCNPQKNGATAVLNLENPASNMRRADCNDGARILDPGREFNRSLAALA